MKTVESTIHRFSFTNNEYEVISNLSQLIVSNWCDECPLVKKCNDHCVGNLLIYALNNCDREDEVTK